MILTPKRNGKPIARRTDGRGRIRLYRQTLRRVPFVHCSGMGRHGDGWDREAAHANPVGVGRGVVRHIGEEGSAGKSVARLVNGSCVQKKNFFLFK